VSRPIEIRTVADLERTARSLALHFKARTVVVVGSQGILVGWPGAPVTMCMSPEIDAYPANARAWEAAQDDDLAEASEEISVIFGEGSPFHAAHGFYIDGVDDRTARLPPSWPARGGAGGERPRHGDCDGGGPRPGRPDRFQARPPRRQGQGLHRGLPSGPASRPCRHPGA
jgi:hypothetical protein